MSHWDILGDTLLKGDGTEFKTSDLPTNKGGVIGLYFCADWCPPCRAWTPTLTIAYKQHKHFKKDFEIIFVSWDNRKKEYDYFRNTYLQYGLAIPYANTKERDACTEKYKVSGIPTLVMCEADTGDAITSNGRVVITEYGSMGFPWTAERLDEAKRERWEAREEALKEYADLKFLDCLVALDEPGVTFDLQQVARQTEVLALAFLKGMPDKGSAMVAPAIAEAVEKLGREKLSVIIVPLIFDQEGGYKDDGFPDRTMDTMKGYPMIPEGDHTREVIRILTPIFGEITAPHVLLLDTRDESCIKIITVNAARSIYYQGEEAYPWTEEAIAAVKEREEALRNDTRSKKENLKYFTPSEKCHLTDKQGVEVPLSVIQSADIIGLYFSARWSKPCREYTPKLVEVYNTLKKQGKSFEIVYVSCDEKEEVFKESYSEMPWCTLDYNDKFLIDQLSDLFIVQSIPALILLNPKGEIITKDGRTAAGYGTPDTGYGAKFYPWDPESVERGRLEEEERQAQRLAAAKEAEEKGYVDQEAAGMIVIRRHRGAATEITIGVDHIIMFETYVTAAAPCAVVPQGAKVYYEITFIEGAELKRVGVVEDPTIAQVGWAISGFEPSEGYSGDGVGDDDKSWGFDGQRGYKWHRGSAKWGKEFKPNKGHTLGVAADLMAGKVWFGLDGYWGYPFGPAFQDLDCTKGMFPVLTCARMKVAVNFGHRNMKFLPPDDTFKTLKDVVDGK